ncbi:MAG: WxcM-like domain-containing protein [Betaproteobacteria bacterium]|nr:WxcM-like domain-containing protein [Betaproteobacteria bacterium]
MRIEDCRLIDLPRIGDPRGNLTFIEGQRHIPFAIARVFYLYDVPDGAARAGHALKTCHQFLAAISGGFDAIVDDGRTRSRFQLNRSDRGLYLPPKIWRELENFSPGAVCLVLASEPYDASGYYRDYAQFRRDLTDTG